MAAYSRHIQTTSRPLIFILFLGLFLCSSAYAEPEKDVRLVIDISGSMKKNDPQNLRRPAVELITRMLPPDAKAGVWTFGQQVNMLVAHKPVTEQWRKMAARKAAQINSVGLYTNIGGALDSTLYDLSRLKAGSNPSVILLTDGMVDIDRDPQKNIEAKRQLLEQWLPKAKAAGVVIHTIALSEKADTQLMERLALETDGIAATANSADELMSLFLRAMDDAAPSDQVPLKENSFLIDSSIEEMTALIFHEENAKASQLRGPDGSVYKADKPRPDMSWFSSKNYDLVTLKQPLEGEWKILADPHSDTRVNVISDLSLKVNRLPKNIFPGNVPELAATLVSEKGVISDAKFLELIDVSVLVKALDEHKSWRKSLSRENPRPADGRFLADISMLQNEGRYEVIINVDGKSFQRQKQQLISVKNPFEFNATVTDEGVKFTAYGRDSDVDYRSLNVSVRLQSPDGNSRTLWLKNTEVRNWSLYQELLRPGLYKAQAKVEGRYSDGNPVSLKLEPKDIYFNTTAEQEAAKKAQKDAEIAAIKAAREAEAAKEAELAKKAPVEPEKIVETQPQEEELDEEELDEEELVEPEASSSNWLLYALAGVATLLLAVIGFFAYRFVKNKDKKEQANKQTESIDAEGEVEPTAVTEDEDASTVIDLEEDEVLAPLDLDEGNEAEQGEVVETEDTETVADEIVEETTATEAAVSDDIAEQGEATEEVTAAEGAAAEGAETEEIVQEEALEDAVEEEAAALEEVLEESIEEPAAEEQTVESEQEQEPEDSDEVIEKSAEDILTEEKAEAEAEQSGDIEARKSEKEPEPISPDELEDDFVIDLDEPSQETGQEEEPNPLADEFTTEEDILEAAADQSVQESVQADSDDIALDDPEDKDKKTDS